MPRVTISIPTYNRADLLLLTLRSALAQTYTDREIIVIDNASTDETPQMMEQFAGQVRYIRKPVNKGLADSYNMGFREAAGEFILQLDSDDIIHPTMIAKQVAYLDQNPKMDFVRVGGYYVNAEGEKMARVRLSPTGPGRKLLSSLIYGNLELCGSILWRKSTIDRVGVFDESMHVYVDWDLHLRLAIQDCYFGFLSEPLFFYRFHDGNSMKKVQAVETASNTILDKLFANPDLPPAIRPLQTQAKAQSHLFLAFSYYAMQAPADAHRCLLYAWNQHPQWRANSKAMLDALLDYSLYMHMIDVEQFASYIMEHLPPQLASLRAYEPALLSRMYLQQAFYRYDHADPAGGAARFEKAIAVDPSVIARRNDFSTLLHKFALQSVADSPTTFVQTVLDNLPASARSLSTVRNTVAANLELVAAYALMNDDKRKTAQHLTNALRLRPALAGRRGVVVPLMRSLVHSYKEAHAPH